MNLHECVTFDKDAFGDLPLFSEIKICIVFYIILKWAILVLQFNVEKL